MRRYQAAMALAALVMSESGLRAAPASTAASPMLEQATPPVTAGPPQDEDSRWPAEARQQQASSLPADSGNVAPNASVSIAAAATAAAEGGDTPVAPAPDRSLTAPAPPVAPVAASATRDPGAQYGSALDATMLRRIANKLVALGFLGNGDEAGDPVALSDAVRAFQQARGIAPTGILDRDTIGQLLS